MTNQQIKLQKKATALNAIIKIYHPLTNNPYNKWSDYSFAEQRDTWVRGICENLEKELKELKSK